MFSDSFKVKMLLGIGAGVSALAASTAAYFKYRSNKLQTPPSKWREIGTIEEIYIFPIKSCSPIKLEKAECVNLGIIESQVRDRALMIIDRNGKVVTARTYNHMWKIQPKILPNGTLVITAPGMTDIVFDYLTVGAQSTGDIKANMEGGDVYVMPCGENFDKWFSRYILDKDEGLRLVYYPFPIPTRRIVDSIFENGIFLSSDTGTFFDVSSYMLIHENSVDELNTRLEEKVESLNFRGNFVVRTNQAPYAEDHWNWVRIGESTIFRSLAPCYRCIFPNINPHTAERNKENEPLKTLKSYRTWGKSKSPRFGVQMGIRQEGILKKGDPVYVEGFEV